MMSTTSLSFDQLPSAVAQLLEKVTNIEKVLCKSIPVEPVFPERLDFNGALSYLNSLGYKISKSKLQKETANRTIPCKRFNKHLVFDPVELQTWAESQTKHNRDHSGLTMMLAKSATRTGKH